MTSSECLPVSASSMWALPLLWPIPGSCASAQAETTCLSAAAAAEIEKLSEVRAGAVLRLELRDGP